MWRNCTLCAVEAYFDQSYLKVTKVLLKYSIIYPHYTFRSLDRTTF